MHLSLFSDAYLSDALNDAGHGAAETRVAGRAYREALLRGVAAICIAGTLLGLTFLSSAVRSTEVGQTGIENAAPVLQLKIQDAIAPGR